ncbi:P-II family nitrogen regulator [Anaerotalea alkaliphila]|uniref:P-II family nitrogen regulator n=1 Tax=Anaerotalea alkaliphila TaxID=2662126 RepID=A0A7X5HUD9_9FIRM|nr:P-II family nitrogen regulator [Anaerotalea alkaliphila]NDL66641.1 P-II family nitrogen regulator [Anaerotalea alkaliphila]
MEQKTERLEHSLLVVEVKRGHGSHILNVARESGISGGTVLLGQCSVSNSLLQLLECCYTATEIVLMVAETHVAFHALEKLDEVFHFRKRGQGIAFTLPVRELLGTTTCNYAISDNYGNGGGKMHQVIFTVVDKGKAETVIDAATEAGSKGGTILNARGSGIHETSKLFSMAIEPEKEMVMILSETSQTEAIVQSIRDRLEIDKPGNGILFILDTERNYGLP